MSEAAVHATPPAAWARWEPAGEGAQAAATGVLRIGGAWTVRELREAPRLELPPRLRSLALRADPGELRMDTAGARLLLERLQALRQDGVEVDTSDLPDAAARLLRLVQQSALDLPQAPRRAHAGLLGDIGRAVFTALREGRDFVTTLGELAWLGAPLLLRPARLRWREVAAELESGGLRAMGIVGLLSFLIGMVMAYQGGATLASYGANVLIVNLVAIITLREMGPLIAAILVAGRTGSSYAAQLGTMRITEEIDALRSLALSPFEMLVLPKVLALVVALPLLSLLADAMGLLGGGMVASLGFGVPWREYLSRIPQVVDVHTLVLGLIKAPVFAVVIALVGCMQGLRVRGSAAAVGRAATASVVQSIFLVIVIDAAFSVLYKMLGL
ncbi:ABC transporter permease [Thiomonas sp. FB-6]|uniref:MlaE family ABC transporter permease n=1 Tax=Thiomonas sp. FB-6 TaxID=1158291 RepID=UPI00037BD652|nr:ABC transporter permease [Thiomonas sp. FB-6]